MIKLCTETLLWILWVDPIRYTDPWKRVALLWEETCGGKVTAVVSVLVMQWDGRRQKVQRDTPFTMDSSFWLRTHDSQDLLTFNKDITPLFLAKVIRNSGRGHKHLAVLISACRWESFFVCLYWSGGSGESCWSNCRGGQHLAQSFSVWFSVVLNYHYLLRESLPFQTWWAI